MKHQNKAHPCRALNWLVTLCLLLALLPTAAFAAETSELTQLTTPTDLTWGKLWGGEDVSGALSWSVDDTGYCQNQFHVCIYLEGKSVPIHETRWDMGSEELTEFCADDIILLDLDSGSYYFTVQAIGDGTEYSDSEVAVSDTWTYTKPDAQLEPISSLSWNWPCATWEPLEDTAYLYGYDVEYWFSETEDDEPRPILESWGFPESKDQIPDGSVIYLGDGCYYFRVRALSRDITQYQNGPWSELSPAYNPGEVSATLQDSLRSILAEAGDTDIRAAVRGLDRDELRSSMLADSDVLDIITQLEEATGVSVGVEAAEDFDGFAADKARIVGAALNETAGDAENITLQISRPADTSAVIPELYNQTLAVRFSMELEGVANTGKLAIPVRVTLPVPSTINPQFLVVLHYSADGTPEALDDVDRYIFQDNGQYYVSFVLDHFSDFAITQLADTPGSGTPDDTTSYLSSGDLDAAKLTKAEISRLLADHPTTMPAVVFDEAPSCAAPYAAGKVNENALQLAVNRLNALREIAGLPAVALDSDLSENAQYGAVLLTTGFSHYPAQPADMDDSFYEQARKATSSSNIAAGMTLISSVDGFMDDSDAGNIPMLGHRRWQLNPTMGKVGFGYAVVSSGYRMYTAEKVFDRSGAGCDYDFIGWPASGNFPNDLFGKNIAWSVTLNPEKYSAPVQSDITVTLTRKSDGTTWEFSGSDYAASNSGAYFGVDKNSYGVSNCIIFRPDGISSYDGVYTVAISGLKDRSGNAVDFSYQVDFFNAENYVAVTPKYEDIYSIEARQNRGALSLTVKELAASGTNLHAYLAQYDDSGMMTDVNELTCQETEDGLLFSCDVPSGAYKLFLLDDDLCPVCQVYSN